MKEKLDTFVIQVYRDDNEAKDYCADLVRFDHFQKKTIHRSTGHIALSFEGVIENVCEELIDYVNSDQRVEDETPPEDEKDWFFTFGAGHETLSKRYVRIFGTCRGTRHKMIAHCGTNWAMQYKDHNDFHPEKWGLSETFLPEEVKEERSNETKEKENA